MWILYAVGSSFFAGITAILAKCGIQKTNSNVATGDPNDCRVTFFLADGLSDRSTDRFSTDQ